MKKFLVIKRITICFIMVNFVKAQNIISSLDTSTIRIGEQIGYNVSVYVPAGSNISVQFNGNDKVLKVAELKPDTSHYDTSTIIHYKYIITSFDTGVVYVPGVSIRYGDTIITGDSLMLRVLSVPVDTLSPIKDIKEIIEVEYSWKDWIKEHLTEIIGVILGIALLATIIAYVFFRKKVVGIVGGIIKREPPHVVALRELEKLEKEQLWQRGYVREYYLALSNILRSYIDRRFGCNTLMQTATEFKEFLCEGKFFPVELGRQLLPFVDRGELAKFARFQPTPAENTESISLVREFILSTVPQQTQENGRTETTNTSN